MSTTITATIGDITTQIGGRHVPLSGVEDMRSVHEADIIPNELHTTSDQKRAFLENTYLGPVWHGTVADEAAMLLLAADPADGGAERGTWPGDACYRADHAITYLCTTRPGDDAAHWQPLGLPRQAAIADADALTTMSQLNLLLAACRAAGLIET